MGNFCKGRSCFVKEIVHKTNASLNMNNKCKKMYPAM